MDAAVGAPGSGDGHRPVRDLPQRLFYLPLNGGLFRYLALKPIVGGAIILNDCPVTGSGLPGDVHRL
jgi:hypothetical protein